MKKLYKDVIPFINAYCFPLVQCITNSGTCVYVYKRLIWVPSSIASIVALMDSSLKARPENVQYLRWRTFDFPLFSNERQ